jgi:hypothetical protein
MWALCARSGKIKRKRKRKGFKGVNGLKGNSGRTKVEQSKAAWQARAMVAQVRMEAAKQRVWQAAG